MSSAEAGFCDAHLGLEVHRCRLLSPKEQARRAGFSALEYYGQIVIALTVSPLLAACILTGLSIAIYEALAGPVLSISPGSPTVLAVMILIYLLVLGWIVWFCFFLPRRNCLVLHQHGLKYRSGWKTGAALFEELREFRVGRDWKASERIAMGLNKHLHPGLHLRAENARHLSLTLSLVRGDQIVLGGILMQYLEEDVNEFLTCVNRDYPHLVKIDP